MISEYQWNEILSLSKKVALKHRRSWHSIMSESEAISEATYGAVETMMASGDWSRPISTCYLRMRGRLLNEVSMRLSGGLSTKAVRKLIDIDDCYVAAPGTTDQATEAASELDQARRLMDILPRMKKTVLEEHCLGKSSDRIAAENGWSSKTVSSALGSAHRIMKLAREGRRLENRRINGRRMLVEVEIAR